MSADIKFYTGVQSEYDVLGSILVDPNVFYFFRYNEYHENNIKYSRDTKIASGFVMSDDLIWSSIK